MQLAFTTLGCQEWELADIIQKAKLYGYAGVDFRGYHGEIDLWKCPEFRAGASGTRRRLEDAGLAIPCLGSSARMFAKPEERARHLEEVTHYAEIAATLGISIGTVMSRLHHAKAKLEKILERHRQDIL